MFAIFFEWQIADGREAEFISAWQEVTRQLRPLGSDGSALFRGSDGQLCGFARWPDRATRDAAYENYDRDGFKLMAECLAGPTKQIELDQVSNLWADYSEQ